MTDGAAERLPVVILAGGLATRLRPITERIPKALVEVAGRPFIEHQLELLAGEGVRQVVLCVGYLGEMVEEWVGDGAAFGVAVKYSYDGPTLLGTGGALKKALPLVGSDFFLMYGDSYLPTDFGAVQRAFERTDERLLMTVFCNEGRWDTSNVWFEDGRILAYEKVDRRPEMRFIDYGLSVWGREVLADEGDGKVFDVAEVFRRHVGDGTLAGYEVKERFYEVGSHSGLAELNGFFGQEG